MKGVLQGSWLLHTIPVTSYGGSNQSSTVWMIESDGAASRGRTTMAISPKMLLVLQKVDASRAEFFAMLRESARRDAQKRANMSRWRRGTSATKKSPQPPRV